MPGYPVGWFQVGYSAELDPGRVLPCHYFGRDLVLTRSLAGVPRAFDGHCPHRGAHLGYGGVVDGESLVCPFHGWVWNESGANTLVPESPGVTSDRCLRSWPITEVSGLILLWHDPEGGAPTWNPPPIQYDGDAGFYPMYPHGASRTEVRFPPQLPLENNVDPAHVQFVHRWKDSPAMLDFGAEGPSFSSTFRGPMSTTQRNLEVTIVNQAWGVGLLYSWFDGLLTTAQIVATTPIDRERSHMRHSIWAARQSGDDGEEPRGLAKAVIAAQFAEGTSDVVGDKRIWEHQIYRERAAFTKEEAPGYAALRRWSRQFYRASQPVPT